jgi:hypothetical protein
MILGLYLLIRRLAVLRYICHLYGGLYYTKFQAEVKKKRPRKGTGAQGRKGFIYGKKRDQDVYFVTQMHNL